MANKKKLTNRLINSLEITGKRYKVSDIEIRGFLVEVMASGKRIFRLRKQFKGEELTITIGEYPAFTADVARKRALELIHSIQSGIDPRITKRVDGKRSVTLWQVWEEYRKHRDLKPVTLKGYRQKINCYLKEWKDRPLLEMTPEVVSQLHGEISKKSEVQANYSFRVVRALFEFAIWEYREADGSPIFKENPVLILKHRKQWNKEKRKQTYIREQELPAWFTAVADRYREAQIAGEHFKGSVYCSLLVGLLTGLRKTEILSLEWRNVDLDNDVLTIEDTKNGDSLELPISPYLKGIFIIHKVFTQIVEEGERFVFPSPGWGRVAEPKKVTAKLAEEIGVKFGYHDLRRTYQTTAERANIGHYSQKRLLNHKDGRSDVTAGYTILTAEELREPAAKVESMILERSGIEVTQ
ncbi:tyrosine-type recombinase/integrase [Vibrio cyclitrophicus]